MGQLRPSGMERMFVSAAQAFGRNAVESIIVGQGTDHPFATDLRESGYRVETIPPIRSVRGAARWHELIEDLEPDVVHIHTEGAFAIAVMTVRKVGHSIPIVRTVHNVFGSTFRGNLSRRVQAAAVDKFVARFIAPSDDVAANERRLGRDAVVIRNWVDRRYIDAQANRLARSAGKEPGGRQSAVIVGNCSPIKNHQLALGELLRAGFSVYHHGDETYASREETGMLNELANRGLLLHRGIDDPLPSLVDGSVFVMPSKNEGMPVALAEAIAVGVPCMVADSPGLRWAAQFGGVSLIENFPQAWRDALNELPTNMDQSSGQQFDPDEGVGRLVALYAEVRAHRD